MNVKPESKFEATIEIQITGKSHSSKICAVKSE